jgi:phosphoglycolate phosphatase-like HAD superfamily hydrolase
MLSKCHRACLSLRVTRWNEQNGIANSIVVGDSLGDLLAARRARALGTGVLSGGYWQDELERAGAYRVYQDPYDLLKHLDELGVRTPA